MEAGKKTILVIDDSKAIRQAVVMVLEKSGYNVVQAGDGDEGLTRLHQASPDLVVCDVNMPKLDGIGFLRRVREMPSFRFLPILMLTTEAEEEKKMEGMEAGARAWVVKPFKPEQLTSAVARLLR